MRRSLHVFLILSVAAGSGCTGNTPSNASLEDLKTAVAALQEKHDEALGRIAELERQLGLARTATDDLAVDTEALAIELVGVAATAKANGQVLAEHASTIEGAGALLEVMRKDSKGDVVVEGANLHVRSGLGSTRGATLGQPQVNGKGNLVIGYNELERGVGRCVGGDYDGESCAGDFACHPNFVCDLTAGVQRAGSHNLIVGSGQSYSSYGCVMAGLDNYGHAPSCFTAGQSNTVTAKVGSIGGGAGNTVSYAYSTVSGGSDNEAAGSQSVVTGGCNERTEEICGLVPLPEAEP